MDVLKTYDGAIDQRPRLYTRPRLFVGLRISGSREVFRADREPTVDRYGDRYMACIGPFRSRRAADFCAQNPGAPALQTVADFERAARRGDS